MSPLQIQYNPAFRSKRKKLIKKHPELEAAITNAVRLAIGENGGFSFHPGLNYEIVRKNPRIWSIRVTDDFRISLSVEGSTLYFRQIGNHKELYRNPF